MEDEAIEEAELIFLDTLILAAEGLDLEGHAVDKASDNSKSVTGVARDA